MLLTSLLTSLQTALSSATVDAQQPVTTEASILETSPRSFQNNVPLGEVESYTLSFSDEVDEVVGTATLVEATPGSTNLYLEMTEPYSQAVLALGTCTESQLDVTSFEPPVEESEPLILTNALEELLHPRLDYLLRVDSPTASYCVEL